MSEVPQPADRSGNNQIPTPPYQPSGSGKSLIVLVLGIASWVVGFIPGIIALVMAKSAREEIIASGGMVGNESYIKIGVVLSWISIILGILTFILVFTITGLALLSGSYPS